MVPEEVVGDDDGDDGGYHTYCGGELPGSECYGHIIMALGHV